MGSMSSGDYRYLRSAPISSSSLSAMGCTSKFCGGLLLIVRPRLATPLLLLLVAAMAASSWLCRPAICAAWPSMSALSAVSCA